MGKVQSQDLKQSSLASEPLARTPGLRGSSHQEMASSERLDTAVPAGNLPRTFPFVPANEFPFMLNPQEMDYELRVSTPAKERIMVLPSLAGRNQLSGLCD